MTKQYPRPQFKRQEWTSLNGPWEFLFDDEDRGVLLGYQRKFPSARTIEVPFAYETKRSGIHCTDQHDIVWYKREFSLTDVSKRTLLHFGAVDYRAEVYVNGLHAGTHEGGHTSFSLDITDFVKSDNTLVVRVHDDMTDLDNPRGKQYWKVVPEGIYYTKTTGIWQTVWLEQVPMEYLSQVLITTDIDLKTVSFACIAHTKQPRTLHITFPQFSELNTSFELSSKGKYQVDFSNVKEFEKLLWSPQRPILIDVSFTFGDDQVRSYFGFRKVSIGEDNQVLLNNKPYFMRLVLDQGYYPDSLLTSPDDDALLNDVLLAKQMGFNGVRKHQKIEEERYLYYADKHGLLVWGELPSAYSFNDTSRSKLKRELKEMILRDYSHPALVVWVPINESWGVPDLKHDPAQVAFLNELYHFTKKLDPTRLVVSNDGWEHAITDLFTIHDYESNYNVLKKRYNDMANLLASKPGHRPLWNKGYHYNNQPVLVTEFGGISYQTNGQQGWGYSNAQNNEDFRRRLAAVIKPLYESPFVQGFCYTQFTDVEQEINGLLTFDRKPKIDLSIIQTLIKNHQ